MRVVKPSYNFYPRSPCGERRMFASLFCGVFLFLSTLSLRRATSALLAIHAESHISIHALLAESDFLILSYEKATKNFYPRSPCGERPDDLGDRLGNYCISIHALLAESDPYLTNYHFTGILFLSTLSLRRATTTHARIAYTAPHFYPRSPCGERLKNPEAVSKYMIFLSTLSLRRATRP